MDYVMSLKYMYILSHKLPHTYNGFHHGRRIWKQNQFSRYYHFQRPKQYNVQHIEKTDISSQTIHETPPEHKLAAIKYLTNWLSTYSMKNAAKEK